MRIFLSYASEDVDAAQKIAAALRAAGHSVFFDKNELKSGREYDTSIRNEINKADAYVFLVSGRSIAAGRYTLTELAFAERRFPNPSGHVLPVMLESVEWARIPPYLTSVTILGLRGNGPAEVTAALADLRQRRYSLRHVVAAAAASVVAGGLLVGALAVLWPTENDPDGLKSMSAAFGFMGIGERWQLNDLTFASPKASIGKIEVRMFDSELNPLKQWSMNKQVLVTGGSGTWALSDDFEVSKGGPQAFVDACFHVAGRDGGKPRAIGYLRALTWPPRESLFSFELVDRATATALSAKTGCDYVL
jgi:hypothetical protein